MQYAAQPTGKDESTVTQFIATRLMFLLYTMPYWTSTLNMLLVPCTLVSGALESRSSHASPRTQTAIILALTKFSAQCLYGYTISSLANGRLYVLNHLSALWVAPYQLRALLLPNGLIKKKKPGRAQSYVPTNTASQTEKLVSDAALMGRFRSALVKDLALLHCSVLFLCAIGVGYWIYDILEPHGYLDNNTVVSDFILGVGWPPFLLIWTAYMVNTWTPVSCLLFPPVRPVRESLLVRDSITGVAYPNQQAKNNWYRRRGGWHLHAVGLYHVTVLVALFCMPDLGGTNTH